MLALTLGHSHVVRSRDAVQYSKAVAAAGGVDVLVAGEGSKLSDAVGVSTRAAHEAAERSCAKNRQGGTFVIAPDGTVKYFSKVRRAGGRVCPRHFSFCAWGSRFRVYGLGFRGHEKKLVA